VKTTCVEQTIAGFVEAGFFCSRCGGRNGGELSACRVQHLELSSVERLVRSHMGDCLSINCYDTI